MSDTEFELRTNWEGVRHCRGHVLVGGLGLGLCLKMLDGMEKVESIVCVERSSIVINVVAQHLHLKKPIKVVNEDLYDFLRLTKQKFDTAYADLTYDYNSDHYAEHVWRLKKACKGVVKNPRVNARYWMEEYLKHIAKHDHGTLSGAVIKYQNTHPVAAALGGDICTEFKTPRARQ